MSHETTTRNEDDVLKLMLAFIVPPLPVYWEVRLGQAFWISFLFTFCGFYPGVIHAMFVIIKRL